MKNKKVVSSILWKLFERIGTQLVQFCLQLILARLLLPEDYGIISLTTVFIAIATTFVEGGFNLALLQKKDSDKEDFSSVFTISLCIALIMYIIILIFSPLIGQFFSVAMLSSILPVLAISLIIGAFTSLQSTYLVKKMEFKKIFYSGIVSLIISGLLGIYLAVNEFGVWSLVIQQITQRFVLMCMLLKLSEWKPIPHIDIKRTKQLFSFGWKICLSNVINTIYLNIYNLAIGRIYSDRIMGLYTRADQFPHIIAQNVSTAVQTVMLPVMAEVQDDIERLKTIVRNTIKYGCYIMFPLMMGMSAVAMPMVLLLLGENWIEIVPLVQILCFMYMFYPIHVANLQGINAMGRSDIYLKIEIVKKVIGIGILIITVQHGIIYMVIGMLCSNIISSFINALPNIRLLKYTLKEQATDILPSLLCSTIMYVALMLLPISSGVLIFDLLIYIIIGISIYVLISMLLKLEQAFYIISLVMAKIRKGG